MDPARQCTAQSKQSGNRCKRAATPGLKVCAMHGGKSPQALAAAERNLAAQRAERAVVTYGLPLEVDPLDALLAELHRTAGHVAWLADAVQQQDTVIHQGFFGQSISVWVDLYQRERKHLADVARACAAAGVEERRVRIAEEQGQMVAAMLRRVIAGLGRDPQDPEVRELVHRELIALAAA